MAGTVKVRVREGWGVVVDGTAHTGGAEVSVPADLVEQWTAAGWVDKAETKASSTSTRRKRKVT